MKIEKEVVVTYVAAKIVVRNAVGTHETADPIVAVVRGAVWIGFGSAVENAVGSVIAMTRISLEPPLNMMTTTMNISILLQTAKAAMLLFAWLLLLLSLRFA